MSIVPHPETAAARRARAPRTFREDFAAGMRSRPRHIPPKYFYDATGSRLFDEICEQEEYFSTRTELAILRRYRGEIRRALGRGCRIVEFGSGSSLKAELLLGALEDPRAYLPVEISREALGEMAAVLAARFPTVEILPVCADYAAPFSLPPGRAPFNRTVTVFLGSTIGNFEPPEAEAFLARARALSGEGGGLLIGIALQTDADVLERAYNDASGVTAAFNRNVLHRARRELGALLDPAGFRHEAIYNREDGRIEMRLISRRSQVIELDGEAFLFDRDDAILTEYSYKFTLDGFRAMAGRAGFAVQHAWVDARQRFGVLYLQS